jgi:hypothetical protein
MKTVLFISIAAVLALAGLCPAQETCPNTKASQVPARIQDSGPFKRCSVGIAILGHQFGIGGGRCPMLRLITPAHQECRGNVNIGTRCVYEQTLAVRQQRCGCMWTTVIGTDGTGIIEGECVCVDAGTAGTVEDASTETCH